MKMLRNLALAMLVLALCIGAACAETKVEEKVFNWASCDLNVVTGTMMVRENRGEAYYLMDANGNRLSNVGYTNITVKDGFFEVKVKKEGLNITGVVDAATGAELVPMQYADINYLSKDWLVGVVLTPSEDDTGDYSTIGGSTKKYYMVDHCDFYYQGQMVGTLERSDYDHHTGTVRGKYLWIRNRNGDYFAYTPEFVGRAVKDSSEYTFNNSDKTVIHNATDMQAFTPGCTLTNADVNQSVYEIGKVFYDLQGNKLFDNTFGYVPSFQSSNYVKVKQNELCGLIDRAGNVVLPFEFNDIITPYSPLTCYESGFVAVVKDGKLGMADKQGHVMLSSQPDSARYYAYCPFIFVNLNDGTTAVVSALIGELPTQYADYKSHAASTASVFIAERTKDELAVIGLLGEEVVPYTTEFYDFYLTNDGSIVVGRERNSDNGKYVWHVYHIDYDMDAAIAAAADYKPVSTDWTCPSCGTKNTGKFCGECGAKKPE